MADYISRNDAVCIADYAADVHPYDKDRTRQETYSEYNQGWNDACDFIRGKLETAKPADGEPLRQNGCWEKYWPYSDGYRCSCCKNISRNCYRYCPNCGAKMDLEGDNGN